MKYIDFKNKYLSSRVDADWWFGYQCVDLAKQYSKEVFGISLWRTWHAQDRFRNEKDWVNFKKISYSAWKIPPTWAIIFWAYWSYWHVAIVDEATATSLTILEQNWIGDNPNTQQNEAWDWIWWNAIRTRKTWYNNVIGWFVDLQISKKIDQIMKWNSDLWNTTEDNEIKKIMNQTNTELRKRFV